MTDVTELGWMYNCLAEAAHSNDCKLYADMFELLWQREMDQLLLAETSLTDKHKRIAEALYTTNK